MSWKLSDLVTQQCENLQASTWGVQHNFIHQFLYNHWGFLINPATFVCLCGPWNSPQRRYSLHMPTCRTSMDSFFRAARLWLIFGPETFCCFKFEFRCFRSWGTCGPPKRYSEVTRPTLMSLSMQGPEDYIDKIGHTSKLGGSLAVPAAKHVWRWRVNIVFAWLKWTGFVEIQAKHRWNVNAPRNWTWHDMILTWWYQPRCLSMIQYCLFRKHRKHCQFGRQEA